MVMPISQSYDATAPTPTTTTPADPAAVAAFQSMMAQGAAPAPAPMPVTSTGKLATDEQMAQIPSGDLQALRDKWGSNEDALRAEAYDYWLMTQSLQKSILDRMITENSAKLRELFNE